MLRIKLLFMAALIAFSTVHSVAEDGFSVGDVITSFDEFALVGDLPQTEGKVVLVDFWASWCAPCKAAFPSMDSVYEKFREQGFEILAVSVDQKESLVRRFETKLSPSFPIVWDAEKKMVKAAKVSAMPTSYLLDRTGTIRYIHTGWHGKKSLDQLEVELSELLEETL